MHKHDRSPSKLSTSICALWTTNLWTTHPAFSFPTSGQTFPQLPVDAQNPTTGAFPPVFHSFHPTTTITKITILFYRDSNYTHQTSDIQFTQQLKPDVMQHHSFQGGISCNSHVKNPFFKRLSQQHPVQSAVKALLHYSKDCSLQQNQTVV